MEISFKEIKSVLMQALEQEKRAEKHCDKMLKFSHLNGFTETIIHIKNDEIEHQKLVRKLLDFLSQ